MAGSINKLQAITAFVRVVEEGGFTAAAARLGTSASAVTKIIARLEEDVGARLFNRTTRSIALTECGEVYYQRCVRILEDIDETDSMMREITSSTEGHVSIAMPYSFGADTVIPALPEFYRRFPSITLDLNFQGNTVELVNKGIDLVVQTGELPDSGSIRRVLLTTPTMTVASPAYLSRRGAPLVPTDLRNHNCVIGRRVGSEWRFKRNGEAIRISVAGSLHVNNGDALREAARAGIGIAHSTRWLFRRDVGAGKLVPVLTDYQEEQVPVSILYSAKRHLPTKVKSVIEFLVEATRFEGDGAESHEASADTGKIASVLNLKGTQPSAIHYRLASRD